MATSKQAERIKIKRHGERMKLAREKHGTHLICPDCYIPHKNGRCPTWTAK